ncbi:two-component regulator propeller domain-containing protein [Algoriphagus sp. CAU 1675]|uniref:two-component regulator propeller domain-containing protein n=1 Tax=Algoriphagus sp. CAU 1675 TaxID=3032597 RepID=UPI0023DB57FD|nr:two-component regulator propeller domain-containing protein [Algoriphagus sp. CAU 1675]MDF2157817.1 two-component regulator propeller domain-containing protein [Algoriphagus sp. CAU 1675]
MSVKDGLSQNSAVSVTQDLDGFLWIATQEGLNKFDGRQFTIYPKKFNDITQASQVILGKVVADSKNRIWIIPESTVPEILKQGEEKFQAITGISAATQIYEDEGGQIWISTLSGQLYLWNEKVQDAELVWSDPGKEIVHLSSLDPEHLLLTFSTGVYSFHKSRKEVLALVTDEEIGPFSVSKVTDSGLLLVGTLKKGLWVLDSKNDKMEEIESFLGIEEKTYPEEMILDILIDSNNLIWLATYGNGAVLLDLEEKKLNHYSYRKQNPRSIHYNDILCLYEDYSKTIWFGSDGAGLSFYDSYLEKFNFYHNQQVPEEINIDVIRAIYADNSNKIWLGTSGKGLTVFDRSSETWKTLKSEAGVNSGIQSDRVMSLLGNENELWIGYQDEGLSILNTESGRFEHFNSNSTPQLPINTVWKIFKDSQSRFWLCTRNEGLIWFDPEKGIIKQFIHDPRNNKSIPDNNIRTIIESKPDEFWIGTENQGIAKLDLQKETFERFSHQESDPNSISSNSIKSLYLSPENDLWIGTNGTGLNRMDLNTGKIEFYNTENGLPNNVIYGILPDQEGNLWLSSNRGISEIKKTESEGYKITNYSNYDGLATEFNTGAYFRHPDGTLYFGSLEGFYWFRAEDISMNEIKPKTAISSISSFDKFLPLQDGLVLSHDQNTITFNIASLVFSSPEKNEFLYQLVGHDENWISNGNNNLARYTNLEAGTYTFMAKSSNYDGIWSDEPVSFNFTILPPWYLSIWAEIAYLLIAIFGIWRIYAYLRWRWEIRYELQMKEEEARRLREIDDFKTNFFTNISHEFRTPLTLIMGPVQRLMNQSDNPVFKSQLNLIKQNSTRLLNLVDQLLEASKIKSGKLSLQIKKGNLGLLIQTITMNFFYLASEKGMKLVTSIPLMTEIWFDADKIEKIVSNLLQNAIKYGKPNSKIELTTKITDGRFCISVKNHSIKNYSQQEIDQLFTKFFKPDRSTEGFGIGLPMIKDLVELHKGEIQLRLGNKEIFEVWIELPVDKYSFSPDDVDEETDSILGQDTEAYPVLAGEDAPLVLVVEDNDKLREFLITDLKAHFNVIQAENGKQGLFLAMQKVPDLVISDVMMPEMDGIELCKMLKNDEKTSHIPVILLTAKTEEENLLKGLEVGADDYIHKPFSIRQLLIRIEKLIELRKNLRIRYSGRTEIKPEEIAITSTDEKFLEKIQNIVNSDLMDSSFTVDEFCKKLGMSRMQLHRKLTALTGLSTTAFIRDQRLRKSLQKLEKSDETVSEIAYSVGFSSPSYFIKCFKETYQMTPLEYQQSKIK